VRLRQRRISRSPLLGAGVAEQFVGAAAAAAGDRDDLGGGDRGPPTRSWATSGSWLYESRGVEDLVGYTPEESGQPGFWMTILHTDNRERVLAEDRRVELTGDPRRMEYGSITKDGRVVWLRDHAVLVHGGPGEPSYWHGFVIDITEQKLAEQAMREALDREQRATRQLPALDEAKNVFLTAWPARIFFVALLVVGAVLSVVSLVTG
jgi:PAS domain S-box-containing protein